MYKNLYTARVTAKAWERRSEENVTIAIIDRETLSNSGYVQYLNTRKLTGKLDLRIDEDIWLSTPNEVIV